MFRLLLVGLLILDLGKISAAIKLLTCQNLLLVVDIIKAFDTLQTVEETFGHFYFLYRVVVELCSSIIRNPSAS